MAGVRPEAAEVLGGMLSVLGRTALSTDERVSIVLSLMGFMADFVVREGVSNEDATRMICKAFMRMRCVASLDDAGRGDGLLQ